MAEVQANRLREMMHIAPQPPRLRVSTAALDAPKSILNSLKKGYLLMLPIDKIEAIVVDENYKVVGKGEYGVYNNTPSILVSSTQVEPLNKVDSKKYNKFQILFGEIERRDIESGKIVPLHRDSQYDVSLYVEDKIVAYANLVVANKKIALNIERLV